MPSLAELKTSGEQLGLTGVDLARYIQQEQAYERNLRAEELVEKRKVAEHERAMAILQEQERCDQNKARDLAEAERAKQETLDAEARVKKETLDAEAQVKKELIEAETNAKIAAAKIAADARAAEAKIAADAAAFCATQEEAKRDHLLLMANAGHPVTSESVNTGERGSIFTKGIKPKLPQYNDGDDLSAFLIRFERMADMLKVQKHEYAVLLGSALQGYAVEVYSALSPEITGDYDLLKASLLAAYNQGYESFRRRFRELRIQPNQSYEQHSIALGRLFDLWYEAEGHDRSFEAARAFIVKDQLIRTAPQELRTYVQEHNVHDLKSIVSLAHNYSIAHTSYSRVVPPRINKSETIFPYGNRQGNLAHSQNAQQQGARPKQRNQNFVPVGPRIPFVPGGQYNNRFKGPPGNQGNANVRQPFAARPNMVRPPITQNRPVGVCWSCGDPNHTRNNCPTVIPTLRGPTNVTSVLPGNHTVQYCGVRNDRPRKWVVPGTINAHYCTDIVRDSGCSSIVVSDKLVPTALHYSNRKVKVQDYLGRVDEFPIAKVYITCPFFEGWTDALLAPLSNCSALIGNVTGAHDSPQFDECNDAVDNFNGSESVNFATTTNTLESSQPKSPATPTIIKSQIVLTPNINVPSVDEGIVVQAVSTRASKAREQMATSPVTAPFLQSLNIDADKFLSLQKSCVSLEKLRNAEASKQIISTRDGSSFQIVKNNNYYVRKCLSAKNKILEGSEVLLVPAKCIKQVLQTAHESLFAGHFSHRKTEMLIKTQFFWPSMSTHIKNFVRSCSLCQSYSLRKPAPAPLGRIPVISEPFSHIAMDIVGPLSPCTSEGHKYILTIIDVASGFPECVPMRNVDSISVAEALVTIFSRFGIPKQILSDQGRQFISKLMDEVHRMLDIRPVFSSIYHSQSHGKIERLNGTLQTVLRKLCAAKPQEWHRYLPAVMFSIREIPSDRHGFSPFQLLFGRTVRGPVSILREMWENPQLDPDNRNSFQYVLDLKEKLALGANLATENAKISVNKYSTYFDLKSKKRSLLPNQEVLVFLPDTTHKLTMKWSGPYKVLDKTSRVNYLVDIDGTPKIFHINLLKLYLRRGPDPNKPVEDGITTINGPIQTCMNCVIDEELLDPELNFNEKLGDIKTLDLDDPLTPQISDSLNTLQQADLRAFVNQNQDVFSNIPGCTKTVVHSIQLTTATPVRAKMYPVPVALQNYFNEEVDNLISLGIIIPANSPYSSPPLLVKKRSGLYRLALDFRNLNSVTVFQAEPIQSIEEDLHKFAKAKFFSELDLVSAFFQIPLDSESQKFTAFPTNRGQMQFTRLAFGLINSPSTFVKLMREVLDGLSSVTFYFDNVIIHTQTWEDHIDALQSVIDRLRYHQLTLKPSKCKLGYFQIDYLGFVLGPSGTLRTQPSKVKHLASVPPPTTKKQLRSFLGMIAFYRKFIPQCSQYTAPLSDLTRKAIKEPLPWTNLENENFQILKQALCSDPILRLPDLTKPFILRTDASNTMVSATLMQQHNEVPHPVAYYSRKLLPRECNYSTIERECLAILNGIEKFKYYLLGVHFFIQTDHLGLVWLNKSKNLNSRLIRWALILQSYRFTVLHLPGKENIFSDFLSRTTD